MEEFIASFLVQKGICRMPFGDLSLHMQGAVPDRSGKVMAGPEFTYRFQRQKNQVSREFADYLSHHLSCNEAEAVQRLEAWSENTLQRLQHAETIHFPLIGTLTMEQSGKIQLNRENTFSLFPKVNAEVAVHKDTAHTLLVGDTESDSREMHHLLHENVEEEQSNRWWIAAIILLLTAAAIYGFFYFTGNHASYLNPQNTPATYISK
ncbi:MAG: hypothetical protein M9898_06775 [Chitinophagaceae bacterium]|nr:hypothetical protein [Chitinophagaceae bacterium]